MGIIRILLSINIELAGDKLNGGDEGNEKDGSKNRTLRNTCFELGCGGDILTKLQGLAPDYLSRRCVRVCDVPGCAHLGSNVPQSKS